MAIASTTIVEIHTGGAVNNSGLFDPAMAGMLTDLAVVGTTGNTSAPVVSSASYNFVAGDVGHWVFIQSGTNWIPGWYQIASVASNQATLSAGVGQAVLYSAFALNTTVGVATVQSPTAGTWAIDYSRTDANKLSNTDFATGGIGSTTLTTATANLNKAMVGNAVHLTSGTNLTAGWYFLTAVASTSSATIDRAADNGAGGVSAATGAVGGALSDPALATGINTGGLTFFIKSGTYTITSTTANGAGGRMAPVAGGTTQPGRIIGFTSNRILYNTDTRPLLQLSTAASNTVLTIPATGNFWVENINMDGAGLATSRGIDYSAASSGSVVFRCKGSNFTNGAFFGGAATICILCEATGCSTNPAFNGGVYWACVAHDNTITGFYNSGDGVAWFECISCNNTGGSSDGFQMSIGMHGVYSCTSYGNGRDGYRFTSGAAEAITAVGCIAENNAGWGFRGSGVMGNVRLMNCGGFNNTLGLIDSSTLTAPMFGTITASSEIFANPGSNDFRLNNGAGALFKRGGIPGSSSALSYPGLSTPSYLDVGAAQGLGMALILSMQFLAPMVGA